MALQTVFVASALLLASAVTPATPPPGGDNRYLSLCYHDVVTRRGGDPRAVEERAFIAQIEFLRSRGAHFLSVEEILAAERRGGKLPPNSVLLTFDDGCRSFHRKVLPILELYRIPAVLSVVTAWSEQFPGADCEGGIMTWDEIAEVARSKYVEIGSHTHDMHRPLRINPEGSTAPALVSRIYHPGRGYESEEAYRERVTRDFTTSMRVLKRRLGRTPRVLTWPYGAYSPIAVEEARRAGYSLLLSLYAPGGDIARLSGPLVPRRMLEGHPNVDQFARYYWAGGPQSEVKPPPPDAERGVHADLDLLYDANKERLHRNIDRFIERVVALKPSVVYLQAFSDDSGSGNVKSVYFRNRVLPMKADLFSFVARAIQVRGISVYAWMPTLSIVLPDAAETEALRVRELHEGKVQPTRENYQRLSPFSPEARARVAMLFEDLAIAGPIDGVIFQDDAYLDDDEDFHPAALEHLRRLDMDPASGRTEHSEVQEREWIALKTRTLLEFVDAMMAAVRRHRPHAELVRTFYAPVLSTPESERWFAMNYATALKYEGRICVLAYPRMEDVDDADALEWLRELVDVARKAEGGLDRTVFKIQTVDWKKNDGCLPPEMVTTWMTTLRDAGARHLAYYPDNVFDDCPRLSAIKGLMSSETFPVAEPPSPAAPKPANAAKR